MLLLYWFSAFALFYAFVGYPVALKLLASRRRRAEGRKIFGASPPTATIVLSVFDEAAVIEEKIRNFRALDYPEDRVELLVVSDGSTDRTEELVRTEADGRVRLLVQERNMGKTAALNRGVGESSAEVIVFTDANSMFAPEALRRLVAPFADPGVGLVSGRTEYRSATGGEGGGGIYRRYEDALKRLESRLWGVVGADGAIYAMRRSLYTEIAPQYINDFLHPIQVVLAGKAALHEDAAVCREVVEPVGAGEFRRQTRIMAQSWRIVLSQSPGLVAARKWGFLWQLLSHKVLRWLTLPLLCLLLLANLALAGDGVFYVATLVALLAFPSWAWLFRRADGGIKQFPYTFLLLHLSAVTGLYKFLRGEKYVSWRPRKS